MKLSVSCVNAVKNVPPDDWNRCAGSHPFVQHAFLNSLETSKCVHPQTGWAPAHLIAQNEQERIVGAAPLYVKTHSQGEFVFDHAWADALDGAGGQYYPKLLCAVPFTPVAGPRLLAEPSPHENLVRARLADAALQILQQNNLSSFHINFLPQSHRRELPDSFLSRDGVQYIWRKNPNHLSYDDYLASLTSRRRKSLKRERRTIQDHNLSVQVLRGNDVKEHHWDAFHQFHLDTSNRKWGRSYLNRSFFSLLSRSMPDAVVLILAGTNNPFTPVAGALHILGDDALYGRYWGSSQYFPHLHFELCYHQAAELAFTLPHVKRVEAGAQGEHKIERGYLPVITHSAHFIAHPGLRNAVSQYLRQERPAAAHMASSLSSALSPFRQTPETQPNPPQPSSSTGQP